MEDQTARVSLTGEGLPVGELVTGASWLARAAFAIHPPFAR